MMRWYDNGWGTGSWVAMSVMMLFWIALIGVAIWAAVHLLHRDAPTTSGAVTAPTPRSTLDQRLAAGEIDPEQYAQLRRLLEDRPAGGTAAGPDARP